MPELDDFTVGIKFTAVGRVGPHDRHHAHGKCNRANSVINVTVGGTHSRRGNAEDVLDSLTSPAQFGNDLLVRQGRKGLWQNRLDHFYNFFNKKRCLLCGTMCGR